MLYYTWKEMHIKYKRILKIYNKGLMLIFIKPFNLFYYFLGCEIYKVEKLTNSTKRILIYFVEFNKFNKIE